MVIGTLNACVGEERGVVKDEDYGRDSCMIGEELQGKAFPL